MDRRSLLAIALSMLVIAVFNLYFLPKPKPRPASDGAPATADSSVATAPTIGEPRRR